jgi:poly(A) polymerase
VGGAVRDLLVGLRPKDFDVATSATPEQVRGLFRRAFIIGRRFRIVHVVFGRGREHEVIEVLHLPRLHGQRGAEQVAGNEKTSRSELAGMKHAVDSTGRVLRDNVWDRRRKTPPGATSPSTRCTTTRDADRGGLSRRHQGRQEAHHPHDRRPAHTVPRGSGAHHPGGAFSRQAQSAGLQARPKTAKPLVECQALLADVPQSRLFDEMLKLLQTGHSLATIAQLKRSAWRGASIPCSTWWWSAPTSRSSTPPCRTPIAA